jgi:membrane-associated protease RseP (regulator of RpoE activity)
MALLAVGILAIFGLHELGHIVAVRHHKMDATLPYFIPGPPPIGTFGAFIQLRGPPGNRDELFDLGFSGPVTGFAVMIIVAVVALLISPTISSQQATQLFAAKLLGTASWPNEPYLLDLLFQVGFPPVAQGQIVVLSRVTWAVYIGGLVTFLNLLPAWQLDGGHIMRATLGQRWHSATTLVAIGVLFLTGYFAFAILLVVLMFASRRPFEGLEPLDDISPLSMSRRVLFVLSLVMLALSFVIIA